MVRFGRLLVRSGAILLAWAVASPGVASVRPGIEGGVNLASLRYDRELPEWDPGWLATFTAGATFEFRLRPSVSLTTGLRYVREGNRVRYDYIGPGGTRIVSSFSVVQDYLAVPFSVELRPLPSRWLFVSAGPEVGMLLSARLFDADLVTVDGNNANNDISGSLEPANVSLNGSVGFEFPMQRHTGLLCIRYARGLTSIPNRSAWFNDWETRGVEFLTGIRW
jgi:hypothetical protein